MLRTDIQTDRQKDRQKDKKKDKQKYKGNKTNGTKIIISMSEIIQKCQSTVLPKSSVHAKQQISSLKVTFSSSKCIQLSKPYLEKSRVP